MPEKLGLPDMVVAATVAAVVVPAKNGSYQRLAVFPSKVVLPLGIRPVLPTVVALRVVTFSVVVMAVVTVEVVAVADAIVVVPAKNGLLKRLAVLPNRVELPLGISPVLPTVVALRVVILAVATTAVPVMVGELKVPPVTDGEVMVGLVKVVESSVPPVILPLNHAFRHCLASEPISKVALVVETREPGVTPSG